MTKQFSKKAKRPHIYYSWLRCLLKNMCLFVFKQSLLLSMYKPYVEAMKNVQDEKVNGNGEKA